MRLGLLAILFSQSMWALTNVVMVSMPTIFGLSGCLVGGLALFWLVGLAELVSGGGSSSPPVFALLPVSDRGRRLYSIVWLQSLILSPFHGASLSHLEPFRLSMSWSSVRRRPASAAWATMTASKKSMPGAFVYNVLNLWSSDGVYRWNRTFSSSCRTLRLSPKPVWAAA